MTVPCIQVVKLELSLCWLVTTVTIPDGLTYTSAVLGADFPLISQMTAQIKFGLTFHFLSHFNKFETTAEMRLVVQNFQELCLKIFTLIKGV